MIKGFVLSSFVSHEFLLLKPNFIVETLDLNKIILSYKDQNTSWYFESNFLGNSNDLKEILLFNLISFGPLDEVSHELKVFYVLKALTNFCP